jgi:hypothetical protein
MAKITAYIPEPSQNYDVNNQRQILEAINTIKDQLNFGYQQDLINQQSAMTQFIYGTQSGSFCPQQPIEIAGGGGSNAYDAFGRLRVSNPLTIFDSKSIMSKNNLFDESTANGGTVTYTANKSTVNLNVTEAAGSTTIRQSKRVMSYQPGKSLLIFNTFVMNAQTENLKQKVGLFDGNNGIFFQDTGTGYQIVRRTYTSGAAVDTEVNQSAWNGDKLNGTGPSGFTLNAATSNILFIDIEWLGVGSVRVGFVINGQLITAHTFYNANSLTTVYMQTANLPIRYEINRNGTLAAGTYTLQQICSSCISEGGYSPEGLQQMIGTSQINAGVNLSTANTYYNIATIKIKSGRPYAVIVPAGIDVLNISNNDFEWGLFFNATPSSAFSYTSFNDNIEYDLTTVDLTSTGTRVAGGYLGGKTAPFALGGDFIAFSNQLGQTISGTSDTLTLGVRSGTANGDVSGLIKWYDLT